jgi:hypothetical protein
VDNLLKFSLSSSVASVRSEPSSHFPDFMGVAVSLLIVLVMSPCRLSGKQNIPLPASPSLPTVCLFVGLPPHCIWPAGCPSAYHTYPLTRPIREGPACSRTTAGILVLLMVTGATNFLATLWVETSLKLDVSLHTFRLLSSFLKLKYLSNLSATALEPCTDLKFFTCCSSGCTVRLWMHFRY